jgi:DNA-binding MarR family transcriptional regulator
MSRLPDRQYPVNTADGGIRRRSAAGDAFSGLVARVFRLNGLLAADGDALARPAGQTAARWQVLAMVEDEPMTVARIARTLGLARQSVQRVADLLAEAGLVDYEDNPGDRRARLVRLTEGGRDRLRAIQAAQAPWADAIGAGVGEPDLRAATDVLDRVLDVMTSRRG